MAGTQIVDPASGQQTVVVIERCGGFQALAQQLPGTWARLRRPGRPDRFGAQATNEAADLRQQLLSLRGELFEFCCRVRLAACGHAEHPLFLVQRALEFADCAPGKFMASWKNGWGVLRQSLGLNHGSTCLRFSARA